MVTAAPISRRIPGSHFTRAKRGGTALIGRAAAAGTLVRAPNTSSLVPDCRSEANIFLNETPAPRDPAWVIALRRHLGILWRRAGGVTGPRYRGTEVYTPGRPG